MPAQDTYEIIDYNYGKSAVKLLHVRRDGILHSIREFEVNTSLVLNNQNDYLVGDNSSIVATDTQKNTVYLLARRHGVSTPEEFGILLCQHFLTTYDHVVSVNIKIEMYPWERITNGKQPHHHAFIFTPTATRLAFVSQTRNGPLNISAGLTNLRVLKTTQSSFENFIHDDYTTLPEAKDRIFSTVVDAKWDYGISTGIEFDRIWLQVQEAILYTFAGEPIYGVPSPSVQNTLYLAEKVILDKESQVSSIEITMPNKHYFNFDFSKFPSSVTSGASNGDVFQPVDKPAGMIHAKLCRKNMRSKL